MARRVGYRPSGIVDEPPKLIHGACVGRVVAVGLGPLDSLFDLIYRLLQAGPLASSESVVAVQSVFRKMGLLLDALLTSDMEFGYYAFRTCLLASLASMPAAGPVALHLCAPAGEACRLLRTELFTSRHHRQGALCPYGESCIITYVIPTEEPFVDTDFIPAQDNN